MTIPDRVVPAFGHVLAMSDEIGMFEHADHATPRREHGYCTDDMARLLIVAVREPDPGQAIGRLGRNAFRFLKQSQNVTGKHRNRRSANGRWQDRAGVEDCWGRSVWAFGTAAARSSDTYMRASARSYFVHAVQQRSPHRRAMAFAALGAAEVASIDPRHFEARALLRSAIDTIGIPADDPVWPWPEPRLAYANAVLPDALIAAGSVLGRDDVTKAGLTALRWLLDREHVDGRLSPTPVDGAGPSDGPGRFDQQPIEVAALADACARALAVTGDNEWAHGVELAVAWFAGGNDVGAEMWDLATGGGYDGLTPSGPNLNQGAESTLALIATLQHGPRPARNPLPRIPGPIWATPGAR
ncbi:MAG TPA: hypothetical protein VNQ73_11055 [Ilumatobacter sp.]|nr:hypothetical protein [Ilumatobacter sp.]